jgi:hypothetical protein
MQEHSVVLGRDGRFYILEYWPDGAYDIYEVMALRIVVKNPVGHLKPVERHLLRKVTS